MTDDDVRETLEDGTVITISYVSGISSATSEWGSWYGGVTFPSGSKVEQAGWPDKESARAFTNAAVEDGRSGPIRMKRRSADTRNEPDQSPNQPSPTTTLTAKRKTGRATEDGPTATTPTLPAS